MAIWVATVRVAFCLLVSAAIIKGQCPVFNGRCYDVGDCDPDYFTIHSQADANELKNCDHVLGDLIISGKDVSGLLVIDGPKHIHGDLTILYPNISMKNLISIHGTVNTETRDSQLQRSLHREFAKSDIGTLNFPALRTVNKLAISYLPSVQVLNLPSLKETYLISIRHARDLQTISTPKLRSLRELHLGDLPSLKAITPFTALRGFMESLYLSNTTLTNISFPYVKVLSRIGIGQNLNLTTIDLPSLTRITELRTNSFPSWGGGLMYLNNNPSLDIHLPKVTKITGRVDITGHLGRIEIPNLKKIANTQTLNTAPAALYIGPVGDDWSNRCNDDCPTSLAAFSAPKLRYVEGRIVFNTTHELSSIRFPNLVSAKEIIISNTTAQELENGISMPSLRHVETIHILGTKSRCDDFNNLYCRGGVSTRNYTCGAFKPFCARKGSEFFTLEQLLDVRDYLDWLNDMIFVDCYLTQQTYCVEGYSLSNGFLLFMGFIMIGTLIMWRFRRR